MKYTALTSKTLTKFETEFRTEQYTAEEIGKIEMAAYIANMNQSERPEWTESDIFADFLRILDIDHIETEPKTVDTVQAIREKIEAGKTRSAWDRGVKLYALDLLDEYAEAKSWNGRDAINGKELREWLLNGARDWSEYSYGGSALIYDGDIAERLCNPSELKKTKGGERNPNSRETWLYVQARALFQACRIIKNTMFAMN